MRQAREIEAETKLLEAQAFSATTKKRGLGNVFPSISAKSTLGSKSVSSSPAFPSSPVCPIGRKTATGVAWGGGDVSHKGPDSEPNLSEGAAHSPVGIQRIATKLPTLPHLTVETSHSSLPDLTMSMHNARLRRFGIGAGGGLGLHLEMSLKGLNSNLDTLSRFVPLSIGAGKARGELVESKTRKLRESQLLQPI